MFIARQPIFNKTLDVYGYELLYRDDKASKAFNNSSSEIATATVLGGLFELGINEISNDKVSFINFDYDFLFSDSIELINPKELIIEILEDTRPDAKLIQRLKDLKNKGYKIALDDFIVSDDSLPLVPIADIIKYDIMATPLNTIKLQVNKALLDGKILLAEKVETEEEYQRAKKMGFHLFQGYFFKKPSIVGQSNNKKSTKLSYVNLINELNKEEPSYSELTDIIKSDVNLSYRLLKLINQEEPDSSDSDDIIYNIERSLVLMGLRQIERWVNILMLQDLATDKPQELTRLSLIRSNFGLSLAENSRFKSRANEIYGMLLFSTLDALLDTSMEEALQGINLTDDVRKALVLGEGELYPILQLVYSYEKGDWKKVKSLSQEINISETQISKDYMKALKYCKTIMNII